MNNFSKFIENNTGRLIASLIVIASTILFLFILSFIFNRFIKRQKHKRVITIARLTRSIIRYTVAIIVLIVMLGIWGVDVIPIVTGVGVLGLIIGLGAQSLIKDLIAGISIVFDNYYEIDETVEIKGFKGKVLEIGLKSTRLVNWKGEIKIFSNGEITEVINFSRNPSVGVVDIDIAYQEDINKVFKIIEENILNIKESFPQIIEGPNIIGILNIGNSVTIRITVKTATLQHLAVERGIRRYLKELFEEHNIEMPFTKNIIYEGKNQN